MKKLIAVTLSQRKVDNMMKHICLLVVVSVVLATQSYATIIDNFDSYSTGQLSTVSGGKWNTWKGTSTDAQVVAEGLSGPNAMKQDGINIPDVVAYSPASLLNTAGDEAIFSFDFLAHEPHATLDIFSDVYIGAGNPVDNSVDYNNLLARFLIDWKGDNPGTVPIHLYDNKSGKGGSDYGVFDLGFVNAEQWHHIDLVAWQTVPDMTANPSADADGYFNVFIDSVLRANNLPFGVDNPLGVNTLEIASKRGDSAVDKGYHLYDNISLTGSQHAVPEPSTLLLLGSGLAGIFTKKKRLKK